MLRRITAHSPPLYYQHHKLSLQPSTIPYPTPDQDFHIAGPPEEPNFLQGPHSPGEAEEEEEMDEDDNYEEEEEEHDAPMLRPITIPSLPLYHQCHKFVLLLSQALLNLPLHLLQVINDSFSSPSPGVLLCGAGIGARSL